MTPWVSPGWLCLSLIQTDENEAASSANTFLSPETALGERLLKTQTPNLARFWCLICNNTHCRTLLIEFLQERNVFVGLGHKLKYRKKYNRT